MPRSRIAISKKIALALTGAALLQLGIASSLLILQNDNNRLNAKIERTRLVADALSGLIDSLLVVVSDNETKKMLVRAIDVDVSNQMQQALSRYALLKTLLKGQEAELAVVASSERATLQAMAILQQLKELRDTGEIFDRAERKPLLNALDKLKGQIISKPLLQLTDLEHVSAEQGPVRARGMRNLINYLLIAQLAAIVASMSALYFLAKRNISDRLSDLNDDLKADDNNAKTNEAKAGDEIDALSARIAEMSDTLALSDAKYTAAVDNALDMIISISEEGMITAANEAAGALVGYHPGELIGKNFRSIVHRADATNVYNHLQIARQVQTATTGRFEANQKPLEMRLVNRSRRNLQASWTSQWNVKEKQFFVVVHDVSQISAAVKMKQEVLDLLDNDLLGPIQDLQGFFELLEEGSIVKIEPRGKIHLATARRHINRLLMLTNDLTDLEKARAGELETRAENLNLDKIVDQAQAVVGSQAQVKKVVLDCRRLTLTVRGEADKMTRVLTNLLQNAVEQAQEGTSVLLSGRSQEDEAVVSINYKGQTLSDAQVANLFRDNQYGLGLALSKAFIELQGGQISATSKEPDGTTITFTLPLSEAKTQVLNQDLGFK